MVKRRVRAIAWWGIVFFMVCIAAVVASGVAFARVQHRGRTTVVLAGDPVVVWSQDAISKRVVRLSLPKDTVIEGIHGYGMYSLESLWKLGEIERKGGMELASSLQEALGIPIPWFIGRKGEGEMMSTPSIVTYLRGSYRTNMSLPRFVSFLIETTRTGSDQVEDIILTQTTALVKQTLPDGTTRNVLDISRLDVILGSTFEDERIRREGLTVAVYNTTDTPTLGNRAGRLLGHLGVFVVRVSNATPPVTRCTVTGAKRFQATTTANIIRDVFACEMKEGDTEIADIEVRVGSAYQSRFAPAK